jgi:hypothetical protein
MVKQQSDGENPSEGDCLGEGFLEDARVLIRKVLALEFLVAMFVKGV